MIVETQRFGNIEVESEAVVHIPSGLPGFVARKEFAVVAHPGGGPFNWLQSTEEPGLAFVIADPLYFCPDYRVSISRAEVEDLDLEDEKEAQVWVVCGMSSDPEEITANLAAPIVVNRTSRMGKQVLMQNGPYGMRYPIVKHMRSLAGEANQ